jgi:hypothetical protein
VASGALLASLFNYVPLKCQTVPNYTVLQRRIMYTSKPLICFQSFREAKLSFYLTKHHSMMMYRGVDIWPHAFLFVYGFFNSTVSISRLCSIEWAVSQDYAALNGMMLSEL